MLCMLENPQNQLRAPAYRIETYFRLLQQIMAAVTRKHEERLEEE